jgi:hypothetical protein
MDIEFYCFKCGQHVAIDAVGAGQVVNCPKCGQSLTVPHPSVASPSNKQTRLNETTRPGTLPWVRIIVVASAVAVLATVALAFMYWQTGRKQTIGIPLKSTASQAVQSKTSRVLSSTTFDALFIDESNLQKVLDYAYQAGKPAGLPQRLPYKFLSNKSKEQVSETEWDQIEEKTSGSNAVTVISATVLGKNESGGDKYVVASVKYVAVKGLTNIISRTWISESGKWRALAFPKLQVDVQNAFKNGDYATAKAKSEEWLAVNPYSVDAYSELALAIGRSDSQLYKRSDRSLDDIIRAVITINPDDSNALFLAATRSKNLSIAKAYLKKLEGTSFYANAAFSVALKNENAKERLQFLDGLEMTPALNMVKLVELAFAERYIEYRNLSNGDASFDKLKSVLDVSDASFAAGWSARLAAAACQSGNRGASHKWFEYGITRDPNQKNLQELAKLYEDDKSACQTQLSSTTATPSAASGGGSVTPVHDTLAVAEARVDVVKQLEADIRKFAELSPTNSDFDYDSIRYDVTPSPSGSLVSPYIGNVDYVIPAIVSGWCWNSPASPSNPESKHCRVHVRAWFAYQDAEWVFKELKLDDNRAWSECRGLCPAISLSKESQALMEQHRKRWQTATGR